MAADLTVIILSYNTRAVTSRYLSYLEKSVRVCRRALGNRIQVLVIDNHSSDGTVALIRTRFPQVKILAQKTNLGYSRGNNLALKRARTPYILLLNSDVFVKSDTLLNSLKYISQNRDCDVLCLKLENPDGSPQTSWGFLPTPPRTVLWTLGLENLPLARNLIRPIYPRHWVTGLEWFSTSFFLIKRQVYQKTGGFDPGLFLFMEDVEWCHRIRAAGLNICYNRHLRVVHLRGFTTKKLSPRDLLTRNLDGLLHFHRRHYRNTAGLVNGFLIFGMQIRSFYYFLTGRPELAGAYQYAAGKLIKAIV